MLKSLSFPSVYEATNREFSGMNASPIDAIKIKYEDTDYLVGNLAMQEGYSPHKGLNSSPAEMEYRMLSQAGLLLTNPGSEDEIVLTTGFPFSTYMLYRDKAVEFLTGRHAVEFDASLCGGNGPIRREINVSKVYVIPEIQGCVDAIREGSLEEKDNFFMVSLGYGTCEAVASTRAGLINRSMVSTHGLRHAVNLMANELAKDFYLNLKTEHQIDAAFSKKSITVNRVKHDLSDIREKVLRMYYQEIISPNLRRAFTDDDFNKTPKMYLAGGGARYPELVQCFREEFGEIVSVEVYPEPEKCASHGYCLYAKKQLDARKGDDFQKMDADAFMKGGRKLAVGLDVGNANTCVTVFVEGE